MKLTIDVLSALYRILNVEPLISSITGKIYLGNPPYTGQREDISLNALTNLNEYMQEGIVNLNVHVRQTEAGRSPLKRMREIVTIIEPMLRDVQSEGVFFTIEQDKGFFSDQDRDGMYFYNLRLEYQYIRGTKNGN